MSRPCHRRRHGPALLLLGVIAMARAWVVSTPPPRIEDAGTPVALDACALSGEDFRLLPGVGPVLAGRLEAARVAAEGQLTREALLAVPGVGPTLLARWDLLRPD
jgi:hypothetical protein